MNDQRQIQLSHAVISRDASRLAEMLEDAEARHFVLFGRGLQDYTWVAEFLLGIRDR